MLTFLWGEWKMKSSNMFWPFFMSEVGITYRKVVLELEGIAQGHFNGANACWERKLKKHDRRSNFFWCSEDRTRRVNYCLVFGFPKKKEAVKVKISFSSESLSFLDQFSTRRQNNVPSAFASAFIQPENIENPCNVVFLHGGSKMTNKIITK